MTVLAVPPPVGCYSERYPSGLGSEEGKVVSHVKREETGMIHGRFLKNQEVKG